MMAMVDNVTGMVYWVPTEYNQVPTPPPSFAPVVVPYRVLRPVMAPAAPQPVVSSGPDVVNTTVFVRGVPRDATTQAVETHFRSYGDVVSCHVIRHKDASTNKGIAFVKFHDHAAAQRAIECNSPGVLEQREIFAEWAHPKPATSAARLVPDQRIEFLPRPNAPPVYLAPPATHVITSPGCFPAPSLVMPGINPHLPWIIPTPGASSSAMPPYPSPYNPPFIHVLGFPHPDNITGQEINLALSPNYFPVVDYNVPGSHVSAGPSVSSTDENITPSRSFVAEESSTLDNRKGKENC